MKKIICLLCALLAVGYISALAEETHESIEVNGKVVLWEHTSIIIDPEGEQYEEVTKVTLETGEPVLLTKVTVAEEAQDDIFMGILSREGLAPVVASVSAANMGLHYNLNDYTEEMLQEYIHQVADGNFEEGAYTSEILKSEGGNTYVAVSDGQFRSISTIYDDFVMELYQFNYDEETGEFLDLTDADKAFALELFQGIWTE